MDIVISQKDAGKTIFSFTRNELGFSSALLKKAKFTDGGILVNGQSVTVRYVLREGDHLALRIEDAEKDVSPYLIPVPLPLHVLYEDDSLTVIDKPPRMPAHPSFSHRDDTVANALAYRYRDRIYVFRPVNRLDRDTSGVMLTANTKLAASKMFQFMQSGCIQKYYLAVTDGTPSSSSGTLEGYIRRARDSIMERQMCSADEAGAQSAVTRYRVLASDGTHSLLAVQPVTGRTHQIRVQLASIGCPLTGDTMYGQASDWIDRHALHAFRTAFPHPDTGRMQTVFAPLPTDMQALVHRLFGELHEDFIKEIEMQ